ncbi:MAG: hypothetical protein GKR97_02305 [Rhizobiaceae bacterium]|nr:hypothetical protein [Rhizobiaceae bacterium]
MPFFNKPAPYILALALSVGSGAAFAGNLIAPPGGQLKVTKAQLAINSPIVNVCPAPAKMTGWIFTNKPGTIQYLLARKGGSVSGPYTIQSKTGANGLHMASFTRSFDVHHKVDSQYRILIGTKYGKTLSNWAPLKASCKIQLGG